MAKILKGAPVADSIIKRAFSRSYKLQKDGVIPTLAILRLGVRPDDISYENTAIKKCSQAGVSVKKIVMPVDADSELFFERLNDLNNDNSIHGILMFRPLPGHIDAEKARFMLNPDKDVDGCTDDSLSGVFTNSKVGFPPCTAQAVMEILDFYGYDCAGKRAVVLGRSLVVGRPVAMMLLHKNATPTICHTKSPDIYNISKQADIVITCTGQMESLGTEYFSSKQVVIDVGIAWNAEKNKLCGDVKFDEVMPYVEAITPVPGGVGTVTTAVLISHVVDAASRKCILKP